MKRTTAVAAASTLVAAFMVAGPLTPASAEEVSHVVDVRTPDGSALTLDLVEVPIVGPDFSVHTQAADASFTDVTGDLSVPETYLGTVEGRHDAMVAATRLENGDLWGQVVFDRGVTWFFTDDAVTSTRGATPPPAFDKWPTRQNLTAPAAGPDQYSFQVGFDIDSAYFTSVAGSSAQTAVDHAFHALNNVRATYMQNVGMMPEMGTLRLRTSAASDPYAGIAATTAAYLTALRAEWRTEFPNHPDDQVNVISSRFGGGRAYGVSFDTAWTYAVTGAPKTDWDIVLRHEIAHNFLLSDGHAGGYEGSTIESGNQYARFDSTEAHTFASVRDARIGQGGLFDAEGTYVATDIPPYAATDLVDAVAGTTGEPAVLRPLTNDHSPNGAALTLIRVDAVSHLGAPVEFDAAGEVRYQPLSAPTAAVDHFFYTVADANGMTATGLVLVRNTTTLTIFEAETQQLAGATVRGPADDLSGNFSGGFVNANAEGTITLTVDSPEERDVTLTVRTRNADSKKPSSSDISVNGTVAHSSIAAPTGTTFTQQTHVLHLQRGENVVRYSVEGAAQRVDQFRVDWPDTPPTATAIDAQTATAGKAFALDAAPAFADADAAEGSTETLTFSLDDGPEWLSITPEGRLRGLPDVAGTVTATIRATDAFGASATTLLTVQVAAAVEPEPAPSAPTPDSGVAGSTPPFWAAIVAALGAFTSMAQLVWKRYLG